MSITQENKAKIRCFLAMVPRGLEHTVCNLIRTYESDARVSLVGEGRSRKDLGIRAREALLSHHRRKEKVENPWFREAVGTAKPSPEDPHVSVGYTADRPCSWSVPGVLEGSVWLRIEAARVETVASLRCFGPVMAEIAMIDNIPDLSIPDHSMTKVVQAFSEWLAITSQREYLKKLDSSISLWKEYVGLCWKERLQESDFHELQDRIQCDKLRFRVSCLRDHIDSTYTRQDFLTEFMEQLGSQLLPSYTSKDCEGGWKVNLKDFDLELVVVLSSDGFATLGISLIPYPFLKAKSFAAGGIPPDISIPYLGKESLDGLVRLRPSTAHLLLHLAGIQSYETVLDPCAGIGTIPIEAEAFYSKCIGIGGDIVLNHSTISSAATSMSRLAQGMDAPSSFLAAWDASYLPVRTASIDAVVSDLPFGKQCLSSNALKQLLPLIFLECARVLVPSHGRVLVLCGSPSITESLNESQAYWTLPCTIATPVTIGGLQAWIFRIERNHRDFDAGQHSKRLQRIRGLIQRRERVMKHQNLDTRAMTKKRRIQS